MIHDKGFGLGNGSQFLILAYPDDSEDIQTFRAGDVSRPSGPVARHDFIHAKTAPPYLTPDSIVGQSVSGEFHGVPVLGSYGPGWLVETPFILSGYVLVAASSGPEQPVQPGGLPGASQHRLPRAVGDPRPLAGLPADRRLPPAQCSCDFKH